jgi:hypothetical protein
VVLKVGFPKECVFNTFLSMELVIGNVYLSPKLHESGSLSQGLSTLLALLVLSEGITNMLSTQVMNR